MKRYQVIKSLKKSKPSPAKAISALWMKNDKVKHQQMKPILTVKKAITNSKQMVTGKNARSKETELTYRIRSSMQIVRSRQTIHQPAFLTE